MDGRLILRFRSGALFVLVAALSACSGCSEVATLSVDQGSGPQPQLPPPKKTLIPTLNIAPAVQWSGDEAPTPCFLRPGAPCVAFPAK